jgi:predicted NodU family carbamoyl transferase
MKILGISAGFHDAAATVLHNGNILFAGHAERYSKQKNDADIHPALIQDVLAHAHNIDHVAYYERPWLKQLRQWYAGQGIEWDKITLKQVLEQQVPEVMQYMPAQAHTIIICAMRQQDFKPAL